MDCLYTESGKAFIQWILERPTPLRLRPAEATGADAEAFVQLDHAIFSRQISLPYFFWRFFQSRCRSVCYVAEDAGRAVGVCGLMAEQSTIGDGAQLGQMVDLILLPPYWRTDLTVRMFDRIYTQAADWGLAMLFGVANQPPTRTMAQYGGWSLLGEIRAQTVATRPFVPRDASLAFLPAVRFGPEVDGILKAFRESHPGLVLVQRSRAYLNWRFVENPRYNYQLFLVRRVGRPVGYLVLKLFQEPRTGELVGDVVDVLWTEDRPEWLADMLGFALGHFHHLGVGRASLWFHTHTLLDDVGRAMGCEPTEVKRYALCKVLDKDCRRLKDPSRWFFTMADSESY
jgi:GNAT superfamily N-acetyltransferase